MYGVDAGALLTHMRYHCIWDYIYALERCT